MMTVLECIMIATWGYIMIKYEGRGWGEREGGEGIPCQLSGVATSDAIMSLNSYYDTEWGTYYYYDPETRKYSIHSRVKLPTKVQTKLKTVIWGITMSQHK